LTNSELTHPSVVPPYLVLLLCPAHDVGDLAVHSINGQVSPAASNRRIVSRTVEGAVPTRRAISRVGIPADFNLITSRTWRIANLSVGIQVPFAKPKGGTVSEPEEASSPRATSSRNGGRDHLGMAGEIKSERWARSFRNRGRHRAESARNRAHRECRGTRACKFRY
jgi:hypothetical protein